MDATIKQKWVEALRSGKYTQQRERLHGPDGLCCIGVGYCVAFPALDVKDTATAWAAQMLGLEIDTEIILVNMNDEKKKPFSEIADYIEREL